LGAPVDPEVKITPPGAVVVGPVPPGRDRRGQRVAFALSEIMVVSQQSTLQSMPYALADYYDLLAGDAFGDFRKLIEDVSRHPAMGVNLNMLGNQKPDTAKNIRPDENYAREVMQLMTIGLVQLNADGSVKTDGAGKPLDSYTPDDDTNPARVFTGYDLDINTPQRNTVPPPGRPSGTLLGWAPTLLFEGPDSPQLQRQVSNMCGKRWSRGDAANAEALEAGLRAAGHNPLLTAADQEQLALLLLSYAAHYTAVAQLPPQLAATLRLSAQDATRCLMQKEPGGALLTNLHAFMLTLDPRQRPQATAAYRAMLQAAQANNCERRRVRWLVVMCFQPLPCLPTEHLACAACRPSMPFMPPWLS